MRTVLTAVRDLRASPLRNLLTALSMLVGVLAVVMVSAADQVVVAAVIAQQEQQHGRASTYEATLPQAVPSPRTTDRAQRVATALRDATTGADAAVTVLLAETVALHADGHPPTSTEITWVDGDLQATYRRPLTAGTWPHPDATTTPALAVNPAAATRLGVTTLPAVLRWDAGPERTQTVVVTAVIADGQQEATAYASLAARPARTNDLVPRVLLTSSSLPEPLLEQVLADALHRTGSAFNDTGSDRLQRSDTVADTRQTVATARLALLLCGITALAVAVLGILNVGLATVRERSRELVVRRALGARRRDVASQVVGSALTLAVLVAGAAVGLVLLAVTVVVPHLTPPGAPGDPITMPWTAVRDALAAALLTALAGALAPAITASRLPVADALRA